MRQALYVRITLPLNIKRQPQVIESITLGDANNSPHRYNVCIMLNFFVSIGITCVITLQQDGGVQIYDWVHNTREA